VRRRSRTLLEWPWALVPVGCSVFCLSALVYFHLYQESLAVQSVAQVVVAGIYRTFGFAPSALFCFLLLLWSSLWLFAGRIERPLARLCYLAGMAVMLGVLFNLGSGTVLPALHKGELGALLAGRLVDLFGYYPTLVVVLPVTLASILLATDFFFSERIERWRQAQLLARQSQSRAAAQAPDVGVEPEAAELLRSLGDANPVAVAGSPPVAAAPEAAVVGADDEVDVQPAEERVEPARFRSQRPSAYDRRHAVHAVEDEWVPAAPDAQEIENPETGLAEPLDGEPAPPAAGAPAFAAPIVGDPAAQVPPADAALVAAVEAGPVVPIPRPELPPRDAGVQQQLFQPAIDEALLAEAVELVTAWRRASATLLQRRLRIDYALACQVLAILATRGVIELEADAAHGRVRES
jgi:hypothetical protein